MVTEKSKLTVDAWVVELVGVKVDERAAEKAVSMVENGADWWADAKAVMKAGH